jgi:hypothetical protein
MSSYAFAVVQYQSCWCSNYAPSSDEGVDSCNSDCPGCPVEKCGNESEGLFGYIALNRQPSGTGSPSSPSQVSQSYYQHMSRQCNRSGRRQSARIVLNMPSVTLASIYGVPNTRAHPSQPQLYLINVDSLSCSLRPHRLLRKSKIRAL